MEDKGKKGLLYCLSFLEEIDMSIQENFFLIAVFLGEKFFKFPTHDYPMTVFYCFRYIRMVSGVSNVVVLIFYVGQLCGQVCTCKFLCHVAASVLKSCHGMYLQICTPRSPNHPWACLSRKSLWSCTVCVGRRRKRRSVPLRGELLHYKHDKLS